MPPVFRHGQYANVFADEKNLSKFLTDTTITASMDPGEVTTFDANGNRSYIPGLRGYTVSAEGLYAFKPSTVLGTLSTDDWANEFHTNFASTVRQIITVCPEGASTGRRAYLFRVDNTAYDTTVAAADVISCSVDWQCSSGMGFGRVLRFATVTTTGSGGAVAYNPPGSTTVGGTTGGGVGHFHLVTQSTLTTFTAKIQHSTSGSTWLDLITFTAATANTFQRSTVAGTVKERVRATVSTFTGGAGKSVTHAVAFARFGSPKN